jgi:hypothetical protein
MCDKSRKASFQKRITVPTRKTCFLQAVKKEIEHALMGRSLSPQIHIPQGIIMNMPVNSASKSRAHPMLIVASSAVVLVCKIVDGIVQMNG